MSFKDFRKSLNEIAADMLTPEQLAELDIDDNDSTTDAKPFPQIAFPLPHVEKQRNLAPSIDYEFEVFNSQNQTPVRQIPPQNYLPQQPHNPNYNRPSYFIPTQYPRLPQPKYDIHQFLNESSSVGFLNLQKIIPSNHVIHRVASYLYEEFPLPLSTLILVGLGVTSGMTARKWNCAYQKRGTAPICLYVVAEQKSGKGKTTALNIFQEPFRNAIYERIKKIKAIIQTQEENLDSHLQKEFDDLSKEYKANFKSKEKKLKKDLALSKYKLKKTYSLLPQTQVTPEALEESLNNTEGFFLVAADEQNLIDSLISSRGKKSNGVLLCGRNGGDFHSELRVRTGFNGKIIGSFICFSQYQCIEKIIKASNETGLCERFLMISEPELEKETVQNINYDSQALLDEYASKFDFIKDIIEKPLKHDELITLKISDHGWDAIRFFGNELKNNKLYLSHDILSVMASKADMQIMSIASNLYLLDLDKTTQPSVNGNNYIPDSYIDIAINFFRELIIGIREYFQANGLIGNKEQIEAIVNCFYDRNKSKYLHLNLAQIKHKCEQLKIFKDLKNKRQLIVDLVNNLNQNNIILFENGMYFINPLTQQPSNWMVDTSV
jgi:hypothetical protein